MEDKVKDLLSDELKKLNLFIDSVVLEQEGKQLFLRICLDSNDVIDIDKVVEATKIINPIMDKEDLISDEYILDVYGKSKGSVEE